MEKNAHLFFFNSNWYKWRRFGTVDRNRPVRTLVGNPTSLTDNLCGSLRKVNARKALWNKLRHICPTTFAIHFSLPSQILCYDGIYTSPPSNKKWETTASATANVSTITQTGRQHPSSTNLPTLEGSSGTIRQIFQLDPRKSIVKLPMDKTDQSWLNTHRWYMTGCIPCMPLAIPNHTAAECPRRDGRISGRFNKIK